MRLKLPRVRFQRGVRGVLQWILQRIQQRVPVLSTGRDVHFTGWIASICYAILCCSAACARNLMRIVLPDLLKRRLLRFFVLVLNLQRI